MTSVAGTLLEYIRTFMIISCSFILRTRNFSDIICRENHNANFMFNNYFPKIVPFMRQYGKM